MEDIVIEFDTKEVEKKLKQVSQIPKGTAKVMHRALNRTVAGMKTEALKEIGATYTIKKKDVVERLRVDRATPSRLGVRLSSRGRPIRSIKFLHKANESPGKRGAASAFLRIKKSKSGGFLDGKGKKSKAFIATMPNGTEGIFQRTSYKVGHEGKNGKIIRVRMGKNKSRYIRRTYTLKGRENIEQVRSPGAVQMLSEKKINERIQENAVERFNKNLDHEIKYLLQSRR